MVSRVSSTFIFEAMELSPESLSETLDTVSVFSEITPSLMGVGIGKAFIGKVDERRKLIRRYAEMLDLLCGLLTAASPVCSFPRFCIPFTKNGRMILLDCFVGA